jgi:uncharacterized membrane protein YccC
MSESVLEKRPHLIPAIIAALMLLGAVGDWPYGYYQLLRWVTCGAAVFVAFMAYNWQKLWATWLFGIIAVLFNPLVPIHLTKELWQPIDVICALLFVAVSAIRPSQQRN